MRQRWTLFIPPLLCGLLGALCLVLLAFRPRYESGVGIQVLGVIFAVAIGWELRLTLQPRRLGLIELRPVRAGGVERPGFLVPFIPHVTMAVTFLFLFLVGASLELVISNVVDPSRYLNPYTTGWHGFLVTNSFFVGLCGLALSIVALGKFLPELFSSRLGLAVLPTGVGLRTGQLECFFPWEAIEKVAVVKLRLLAGQTTLWPGIGVTSVEEVLTGMRWRRRMKRTKARIGWHLLVPPLGFTLTSAQISHLLRIYLLYPDERARIGTAEGLARVKTALQIADRTRHGFHETARAQGSEISMSSPRVLQGNGFLVSTGAAECEGETLMIGASRMTNTRRQRVLRRVYFVALLVWGWLVYQAWSGHGTVTTHIVRRVALGIAVVAGVVSDPLRLARRDDEKL
jgi:hypothetical protein